MCDPAGKREEREEEEERKFRGLTRHNPQPVILRGGEGFPQPEDNNGEQLALLAGERDLNLTTTLITTTTPTVVTTCHGRYVHYAASAITATGQITAATAIPAAYARPPQRL